LIEKTFSSLLDQTLEELEKSWFYRLLLLFFSRTTDLYLFILKEAKKSFFLSGLRFFSLQADFGVSDLLSPALLFPLSVLIFVLLSGFNSPSSTACFSIVIGTLSVLTGIKLGEKLRSSQKQPVIPFLTSPRIQFGVSVVLIVIGLFSVFLTLIFSGLPLSETTTRTGLKPFITMPSFLVIPGASLLVGRLGEEAESGLRKKDLSQVIAVMITALLSIPFFLLGYRTPLVALLVSVVFAGGYTRLFGFRAVTSFILAVFLVVVGYGWVVATIVGWRAGPLELLLSRASFTTQVFDHLSNISGVWGYFHGGLLQSVVPGPGLGPRTMVSEVFGGRVGVTLTSTLWGPMLLDFGLPGVVLGSLLLGIPVGIAMGAVRVGERKGLPAAMLGVLSAYLLVGIETGITDIIVLAYFVLFPLFL